MSREVRERHAPNVSPHHFARYRGVITPPPRETTLPNKYEDIMCEHHTHHRYLVRQSSCELIPLDLTTSLGGARALFALCDNTFL
ncbi:hypothetical protein GOBAR_DD22187 [Gossypium barbadense]|nr:hypothetical protein GOBAR_DD22187 [Gossypium barbadense]